MTRDEISLRVERRRQLYRLIDDVSGLLARDGEGVAIDFGGFRRRSQAERAARLLESEARYRMRTGRRAATTEATMHPVHVVGVDRERGIVTLAPR